MALLIDPFPDVPLFAGNNGTEALSLSCISDYQVNLDMSQALTLTRPACLLMCQNNPACEVLIYHGARCDACVVLLKYGLCL